MSEVLNGTQRFKLTLEYDGAAFFGWQRNHHGMTVQQALEEAIARMCGQKTGVPVPLTVCGRTDSGVHALGQVAHGDFPQRFDARTILRAVNALVLPWPVAVVQAEAVRDDFHARFSCRGRSYRYRISTRAAQPVLERGRVWHLRKRLDVDAMQAAAAYLIGKHDFTSFRAVYCQAAHPVRDVERITVKAVPEAEEIHLEISAQAFLHHMVRNITGSLVKVGMGIEPPEWVGEVLAARDRRLAGQTAPSQGLYFVSARY